MGVITFVYGMRVMLWTREGYIKSRRDINWVMVVATIAMFIIATMEVGFGLQSNLNAFIYFHGPGGPKAEFAKISNVVTVMRTVDYALQTFIGDAIMVRHSMCAEVRSKLIANEHKDLQIVRRLWEKLANCGAAVTAMARRAGYVFQKVGSCPAMPERGRIAACGWVVVYIEATLDSPSLLNNSRLEPFITSVLSMTLAMTTMTTGTCPPWCRVLRRISSSSAIRPHWVSHNAGQSSNRLSERDAHGRREHQAHARRSDTH